jgi:FkbM family methyltransferase
MDPQYSNPTRLQGQRSRFDYFVGSQPPENPSRKMLERVWLFLAANYSRLHALSHRRLGINLRGLGWVLRRLHSPHVVYVDGLALYLEPAVASSYGVLLGGNWNEPETHKFLRLLTQELKTPASFIDIGANIGVMALDAARLTNIRSVIAVEPSSECVKAMQESCRLNGLTNIRIIEAAATAHGGDVVFAADPMQANASKMGGHNERGGSSVAALRTVSGITLDSLHDQVEMPCIVLIDVEGSELDVVRGGGLLVSEIRPLIVFEYNTISRKCFSLREMSETLGSDYEIFRLNGSGRLDTNLASTWNCCALPRGTVFSAILPRLLDQNAVG